MSEILSEEQVDRKHVEEELEKCLQALRAGDDIHIVFGYIHNTENCNEGTGTFHGEIVLQMDIMQNLQSAITSKAIEVFSAQRAFSNAGNKANG